MQEFIAEKGTREFQTIPRKIWKSNRWVFPKEIVMAINIDRYSSNVGRCRSRVALNKDQRGKGNKEEEELSWT